LHVFQPKKTVVEEYVSTNGVKYKHTYFISLCNQESPNYDPENMNQKKEVSDVQWIPLNNIEHKIRNTRPEKLEALYKALTILEKMKYKINI